MFVRIYCEYLDSSFTAVFFYDDDDDTDGARYELQSFTWSSEIEPKWTRRYEASTHLLLSVLDISGYNSSIKREECKSGRLVIIICSRFLS